MKIHGSEQAGICPPFIFDLAPLIVMKITRFEDIEAWQEARKLVKLVYDAINTSEKFRKDFRLVNQLQGAAVSTMSNTCPVK